MPLRRRAAAQPAEPQQSSAAVGCLNFGFGGLGGKGCGRLGAGKIDIGSVGLIRKPCASTASFERVNLACMDLLEEVSGGLVSLSGSGESSVVASVILYTPCNLTLSELGNFACIG